MTIKKPGIALLVAFVSVFGMAQTASAGDCRDQIENLRAALNNDICSYSKRKRCRGLNRKLDRVHRKIEKGKWRRALRKLVNFHDVVENLAMRKKKRWIQPADYAALMQSHYGAAEQCIVNRGYVEETVPTDGGDTGTGGDENVTPEIPTGIVF